MRKGKNNKPNLKPRKRSIEYEYPSPNFLRFVREYDVLQKPIKKLFEMIVENWYYPDYAKLKGNKLELHTVGWSGNEFIIEAMMENEPLWLLTWQKSVKGGHYWFTIPKSLRGKKETKSESKRN